MKKALAFVAAIALTAAACTTMTGRDLSGMSFSDDPLVGKFIWHDLITEDIDAAQRFYGEMFGWTFENSASRNGRDYVVARDGGVYVAGMVSVPPRADGRNVSRWLPYLSVTDVDAAVGDGVGAGATVAVAAQNVPIGRVAAIIDSDGAVVGLVRSRIGDPDDQTTRTAPGRPVWTELLANDPVSAAQFYRNIAGFDLRIIERRGGEYTLLSSGGVDRAGIFRKPSRDMASTWLTHFGVGNPEAAAQRAKELGGTILLPVSPELRDGTIAVVTDPAGAVLVLHKTPG
ncbi:MAG: VOC family protein [Woeseiaceae bacterium]|nr:VOC family protein [Woeseiaceae bacterium]